MTVLKRLTAALLSLCLLIVFNVSAAEGGGGTLSAGVTSSDDFTAAETSVSAAGLSISTSARSAILIDATGGKRRELWSQNADERLGMASTTKIMTALVAIESMPLSTEIKIPDAAVGVEGSSVYLSAGETLTLEELLMCVLLESANDAATAVAITVGGSVEKFAEKMNCKADELGLKDTHFTNPHGLDDDAHYTTVRDLAAIAASALDNDIFRSIVSTYRATVPSSDGVRLLINHNRLLRSYEGCIGVKTGFTKSSGRCLVSAAERDGVRLVAVTLNDGADWVDHTAMLDAGFAAYCSVELSRDGDFALGNNTHLPYLEVVGGEQSTVECRIADNVSAVLPRSHGTVTCRIEMTRSRPAPIFRGDQIGRVIWYCDGEVIGESAVVTSYCAAKTPEKNFWQKLFG
ncbi:MAG: D-alanyl-D-alanine carboxypeptidase [Clostridia bacterium]|nr:D-alanyl-D-alanine carboxypeptidase [Clostridia bacterium]